jgi:hypothetical protein
MTWFMVGNIILSLASKSCLNQEWTLVAKHSWHEQVQLDEENHVSIYWHQY